MILQMKNLHLMITIQLKPQAKVIITAIQLPYSPKVIQYQSVMWLIQVHKNSQ